MNLATRKTEAAEKIPERCPDCGGTKLVRRSRRLAHRPQDGMPHQQADPEISGNEAEEAEWWHEHRDEIESTVVRDETGLRRATARDSRSRAEEATQSSSSR